MPTPRYIGRFAPSPTGPLHAGSMLTALASWLDARAAGGAWHLRIEDLDPPRCVPAAEAQILDTLAGWGLHQDGPLVRQSTRTAAYEAALARLGAQLYPCACSRREIADSSVHGIDGPVYPGTCRAGLEGRAARALRVRVADADITVDDRLQGAIRQNLARDTGDFVVRRADGLFAYQLAVVVDDAELGVTDIVRGADLLDSTPRQVHLQRLLGVPTPRYLHLPVLVNADGEKLSKQTLAQPVSAADVDALLDPLLAQLGQPATGGGALERRLARAVQHWDVGRLPRTRAVLWQAGARPSASSPASSAAVSSGAEPAHQPGQARGGSALEQP
ncbi:MAG: tRNA glutamyl-Q(34) synthetase GluQRS [Rhodocyclaceae bacterium]|nr:tRNA glutamyl-Q(34) synthetase GluQRS [Rhodocyclaceae bacterium]